MRGRIRSITGVRQEILRVGWEIASTEPGQGVTSTTRWQSLESLGPVASVLKDRPARLDAHDWWYRLAFDAPPGADTLRTVLGFDGLATVADAWLNGASVLRSENMFHANEVTLRDLRAQGNELLLRFSSLDALLATRRPRPRWRTPMLEHQQLRWFRTTLLGRTPGWSPPVPPIGPWRPVWLETRGAVDAKDFELQTETLEGRGIVHASGDLIGLAGDSTELVIERNAQRYVAAMTRGPSGRFTCRVEIPNVALWWPHTHGEPVLYNARIVFPNGEIDLGHVGFRRLELRADGADFAIRVNDTAVFCRGACWTPLNAEALHCDGPEIDTALAQARAAGMNMLRVGGTMVYESDRFLDQCDAQGIMVWQDFMFASMDYPRADAAFDDSVRREAAEQLRRFGGRPCLTLLCGNSEVEQQAAMWGAPREAWRHPLFDDLLAREAAANAPGIPFWPSSTHGGAFPHQGNAGTTSYYGVGAYRRALDDARRAEIRFAPECLGFSNVPEEENLARISGGPDLKVHSPQWKAGVPRDLGAGWDFEDVRDHYLKELFDVVPLDLRYSDHSRYLEMSRVVSGEAMAASFREWRRARSTCRGALVWFLKDLQPGAGWGIVDSTGNPKAAWFQLRRAWQSRAVVLSDEGGNGVFVHIINELAAALRGSLELALYRADGTRVGLERRDIEVPERQTQELSAAEWFAGFLDLSYAYRFGPPSHEVVVATLRDMSGSVIGEDFYFPLGPGCRLDAELGLTARGHPLPGGDVELAVRAQRCARYVTIRAPGFEAQDQYFHLAPGQERTIALRRMIESAALKGIVGALNAAQPARIEVAS